MRKLFFVVVLLFCSAAGFAQNSGIYLIDSLTKVPVPYATVQNESLTFFETSDENGYVNLTKLPASSKRLILRCVGYQSFTFDVEKLQVQGNSSILLQQEIANLSEVTVTASSAKDIFESISNLDIHLRPINNSQEVLRMVPGLFIGQHAGGGKAEQIFLRGFDLDHGTDINISVDGMPVNMVSHAHGQGYADLHFLIPEIIDKVDFNKGPYFADKGNFTTAGYVEFNTQDYLKKNFVKLEGGMYGSFRGVLGANLLSPEAQDQSLFFVGEGSFTDGYFESPQDFSRWNGLLKYHGKLSDQTSLTASVSAFTSSWNASGQIPERAVESGMIDWFGAIDDTEGGLTSRYNVNTEVLSLLGNGGVVRNQLYYSKYDFELYSNFTFFLEDSVNGDQIRQKESRNIVGYNGNYQNSFFLGRFQTHTDAGVKVRYDNVDDMELTRTIDRTINNERMMYGDVDEWNLGTYWSQKVAFTDKFSVTGALRFDYFANRYADWLTSDEMSTHSSIISPKLNLNYLVNENLQFYLYNGKGFHSNDTRVVVQQDGKQVLPPAYGTDLGAIFKIGENFLVQSALWYLWLDQEFVYVGDAGVVEPGGQTKRHGFDLSVRYQLARHFFIDLDNSYCNARVLDVPEEESYLPLAPQFTSAGGITYKRTQGLNGSLRYRYMSDRPANETNTLSAEGYFIVDGAINYTKSMWDVGLYIQNVFNTQWKETQFETESQLQNESTPVSEIHFTPGTPFFAKLSLIINF